MLRNYNKTYQGEIDFSTDRKAVLSVQAFLERHLSDFPEFLKKESDSSLNEDRITSLLEIYFQRQARASDEIFMFQFQYPEKNSSRTTDMSVIYASPFASTESIFAIEAKRLPTPGSGRQKEYVQGNLGAMERFKRGQHGKHLQHSAVLGYVEKEDFSYWHTEICSWINDLIASNGDPSISWDKNDLLQFIKSVDNVNLYSSVNVRKGANDIHLSHYWFHVN